jgi:hypothetical protein
MLHPPLRRTAALLRRDGRASGQAAACRLPRRRRAALRKPPTRHVRAASTATRGPLGAQWRRRAPFKFAPSQAPAAPGLGPSPVSPRAGVLARTGPGPSAKTRFHRRPEPPGVNELARTVAESVALPLWPLPRHTTRLEAVAGRRSDGPLPGGALAALLRGGRRTGLPCSSDADGLRPGRFRVDRQSDRANLSATRSGPGHFNLKSRDSKSESAHSPGPVMHATPGHRPSPPRRPARPSSDKEARNRLLVQILGKIASGGSALAAAARAVGPTGGAQRCAALPRGERRRGGEGGPRAGARAAGRPRSAGRRPERIRAQMLCRPRCSAAQMLCRQA